MALSSARWRLRSCIVNGSGRSEATLAIGTWPNLSVTFNVVFSIYNAHPCHLRKICEFELGFARDP